MPGHVEGVAVSRVRVDGRDAADRIIGIVRSVPQFEGVRGILLDGVAVGGFNIIDLAALSRTLGLPVVAVTRRVPDFERIRAALRKYFPKDFRRRWSLLRAHNLFRVPTAGEPILATAVGCRRAEAIALVRRTTTRGYWPEPLRLAHAVAHAVGKPID